MGLAGLGLTARSAASVWPGVLKAPAYFTEPWVLLGAVALLILLVCHALKLIRHPQAAKEDFTNPMLLGFCGALPVGMSLVAGGLGSYLPALPPCLWVISYWLLTARQVSGVIPLLLRGLSVA